ncbi:MAG: hypothetical protein J2P49_01985 [Methylocapsa sp.]|nr:hypothetical protein [Methylocapsa sp.]
MGRSLGAGILATAWIFALALNAAASPPALKYHHHASGTYIRGLPHGGIAHARPAMRARRLELVGDPGTGLGFYALPLKYRIGAWRYRLRHPRPWWSNPVLFAIAADAARYNYWIPANRDYLYGVFNPYEGAGTPYFGGYYGQSPGEQTPSYAYPWP